MEYSEETLGMYLHCSTELCHLTLQWKGGFGTDAFLSRLLVLELENGKGSVKGHYMAYNRGNMGTCPYFLILLKASDRLRVDIGLLIRCSLVSFPIRFEGLQKILKCKSQ